MKFLIFLSVFFFLSCEFESKVEFLFNSSESEVVTSYGVNKTSPAESSGQSSSMGIYIFGLTVGKGFKLYSDQTCTSLLANVPSAPTETYSIPRPASYGANYYYITVEDDDGNDSACSSSGAYYYRLPAAPSTFNYNSSHSASEIDPSPKLRIGDLAQGSYVELFTDSNCTEKIAEGYQSINSTTLTMNTDNLTTSGTHNIYARQELFGITTSCSTTSIPYTNIIAPLGDINNHYSKKNLIYGNFLYAVTDQKGINIYNISNPSNPTFVKKIRNSSSITDIYIYGDNLFISDADKKLYIYDLTTPTAPSLISGAETLYDIDHMISNGTYLYAIAYNRIYIYDISDISNPVEVAQYSSLLSLWTKAIALQGTTLYTAESTDGLRIIDVSDPTSLTEISNLTGIGDSRDIVVSGNYVYLASYTSGMHIIDVSDLSAPSVTHNYTTSSQVATSISLQGTNIFLQVRDTSTDISFRVLDVSTPASPALIGSIVADTYSVDSLINGNYIYLAKEVNGIEVVNISTPSSPVVESNTRTFDTATSIFKVNGNYAYIKSSNQNIKIYNISDPTNPVYVTTYTIDTTYSSAGGVNSITIEGNYAYLAIGNAGMEIVDISDPTSPTHVSVIDTTSNVYEVAISGNYAYIADYTAGLLVIDISTKTAPSQVASYPTSFARGVKISGSYAFVSDTTDGYIVLDISTPTSPTLASSNAISTSKSVINGTTAYVFNDITNGIYIFDISDPTNITSLSSIGTSNKVYDLSIYGDYAFVARRYEGLSIIDISDPSAPSLYKEYEQDSKNFFNIQVTSDKIYVAASEDSFEIYEYNIP